MDTSKNSEQIEGATAIAPEIHPEVSGPKHVMPSHEPIGPHPGSPKDCPIDIDSLSPTLEAGTLDMTSDFGSTGGACDPDKPIGLYSDKWETLSDEERAAKIEVAQAKIMADITETEVQIGQLTPRLGDSTHGLATHTEAMEDHFKGLMAIADSMENTITKMIAQMEKEESIADLKKAKNESTDE